MGAACIGVEGILSNGLMLADKRASAIYATEKHCASARFMLGSLQREPL